MVIVIKRTEDPIGASATLWIQMDFMISMVENECLESGVNAIHGIVFPLIFWMVHMGRMTMIDNLSLIFVTFYVINLVIFYQWTFSVLLRQPFESKSCLGRGTCECIDESDYAYCVCEDGFTGDFCHLIDADNDGRADLVQPDDRESEIDFKGFGCS